MQPGFPGNQTNPVLFNTTSRGSPNRNLRLNGGPSRQPRARAPGPQGTGPPLRRARPSVRPPPAPVARVLAAQGDAGGRAPSLPREWPEGPLPPPRRGIHRPTSWPVFKKTAALKQSVPVIAQDTKKSRALGCKSHQPFWTVPTCTPRDRPRVGGRRGVTEDPRVGRETGGNEDPVIIIRLRAQSRWRGGEAPFTPCCRWSQSWSPCPGSQ